MCGFVGTLVGCISVAQEGDGSVWLQLLKEGVLLHLLGLMILMRSRHVKNYIYVVDLKEQWW